VIKLDEYTCAVIWSHGKVINGMWYLPTTDTSIRHADNRFDTAPDLCWIWTRLLRLNHLSSGLIFVSDAHTNLFTSLIIN
jgi:hypothetical protein